MGRMSAPDRIAREKRVEELLKQDYSINQIAREVGVTQQSMHKFLKLRGWKTKGMLERGGDKVDNERRERRKNMPKTVVDRSGADRQKGKS